ncbi:MAG: extracellular solute-binding protein [Spirochaetales bacterium]|nr:extracellular solute-binding protein [Spirochaetales bacterium]
MNMRKTLLILSVLLVTTTMLFGAGQADKPEQTGPSKVSMYANITAIEPILERYKGESGVEVEYTRLSTARYVSTILTEVEANKLVADVVQGPLSILEILREYDVLSNYKAKAAEGYPDWAKRDGTYLFGIEYVGLIYNKDLVSAAEAPKSYMDLTDPKWKGHIVMPDPATHATTIGWLVGLREHVFKSDAEWYRFLEGLAKNEPMLVASFSPTGAPLASGEKKIGVSMPKYIVTQAPAPLDYAKISPMLGSPRAIAITKNAPHKKDAEAFLEFWLGASAASQLATDVGEYVLAPGVYPPIPGIAETEVIPIRELTDEEIQKWGNEFGKIFALK